MASTELLGGLLRTKLGRRTWLSASVIPNSLCMYLVAKILSCRYKVTLRHSKFSLEVRYLLKKIESFTFVL